MVFIFSSIKFLEFSKCQAFVLVKIMKEKFLIPIKNFFESTELNFVISTSSTMVSRKPINTDPVTVDYKDSDFFEDIYGGP